MVKHFFSYLYPVLIELRSGELLQHLEVIKYHGKYQLDSLTVNYSYGGLHKAFDKLFRKINIDEQKFNKVLLLGLGAGSVVSLLTEKYKKKCEITALENDEVVVELAKKYFNVQRFDSLNIIKQDAFKFVNETNNKYDLVIVDLFIDNEVPKIFTTPKFIENLKKITTNNCSVIFNKTTETIAHKEEFQNLRRLFETYFPGFAVIKLISNGMENRFIVYNTLPLVMKPSAKSNNHNPTANFWKDLNLGYNFNSSKTNPKHNAVITVDKLKFNSAL